MLEISSDLKLPTDAATSTLVVYGGKGMGKTNLASVLVEEFAAAHLRFAVIDPMGVWWGLRHAAGGKGKGVKALILGGIHGDMPIEPTSGAIVADLVVDEDESVIIDISRRTDGSMWAIAERVRFVTAYAKRLYQRQGEKRRPVHQVIDEAARFAPQVIRSGETATAECLGAIAVIVEEGRNVGLGVTLVTQRSARLNKDVAELADCMIAFRTVGPNSMRAVLDWLGEHVDKARHKDISEKLRSLPRGHALVVSPGWLEFEGIVAVRKRTTFDSSKTPESGKPTQVIGVGAKVDLAKYRARMAEVIERAEADDPNALKARVAELEKQVSHAAKSKLAIAPPARAVAPKVVEKPIITPADLKRLEQLEKKLDDRAADFHTIQDRIDVARRELADIANRIAPKRWASAHSNPIADIEHGIKKVLASGQQHASPQTGRSEPSRGAKARASQPAGSERRVQGVAAGETAPSKMERAMLITLAQHPEGMTKARIRVFTGYANSGSVSDSFAHLVREGWAEQRGAELLIAAAGLEVLGDFDPLPTGDALRASLLTGNQLSLMEKKLLEAISAAYPNTITKGDARGEYANSGSVSDAFARLVAYGYITKQGPNTVRTSEELFG